MAKDINYKKLSLEDNLSGVIELMNVFPERNSEEEVRKCLTTPPEGPYGIWVAKDKSQKEVGFSIWYHENKDEACFWLIGVSKKYRNNGLSAELLDRSIEDISRQGYSKMFLETFESCDKMKRLCQQRNFKEIGRVPIPGLPRMM